MIELTEEFPVPDPVALSVALNQLRLLGYGVAIDDFGVGIATLKLLADLPFRRSSWIARSSSMWMGTTSVRRSAGT